MLGTTETDGRGNEKCKTENEKCKMKGLGRSSILRFSFSVLHFALPLPSTLGTSDHS
jgi:hypothetical protein